MTSPAMRRALKDWYATFATLDSDLAAGWNSGLAMDGVPGAA